MEGKSLGFIGAGRIARILLGGLKRAGKLASKIVVSDANEDILQRPWNQRGDLLPQSVRDFP